jgi:hypothetical protein
MAQLILLFSANMKFIVFICFFAQVKSVVIPRPPGLGVGKVFVEFDSAASCAEAQAALEGRRFASRVVNAAFFSEDALRNRQF